MKTETKASIHRFGDKVAIWLGEGETIYLEPADALKIAKALNKCAKEIKSGVKFADSTISTINF